MPPTFRAINEYRTTKLTLQWKKVATDLFYWKASTCLLLVDYYSRYIEISKVNRESSEIISHKINLCQAWVLREVVSDNRPHIHPMHEYKQFAAKYDFAHTTSSRCYFRNNREAERAMKTIKSLLTSDISFYTTS